MLKNISIKINLRGAFRQYSNEDFISFNISRGEKVSKIKESFYNELKNINSNFEDFQLVEVSALASDNKILANNDIIYDDCMMDILPPVCGG